MLRINHLVGFGVGFSPATVTYAGTNTGSATASSYSLTSTALGPAGDLRIVGVATRNTTGNPAATAITVDGIVASLLPVSSGGNAAFDAADSFLSFWLADTSANTSGTVAVTLGGSSVGCTVGVWSVKQLKYRTAIAIGTDGTMSSGVLSASVVVPALGFAIGIAFNSQSNSLTWTELNGDFNNIHATSRRCAGASNNYFSGGNPTITCTSAGGGAGLGPVMLLASFR